MWIECLYSYLLFSIDMFLAFQRYKRAKFRNRQYFELRYFCLYALPVGYIYGRYSCCVVSDWMTNIVIILFPRLAVVIVASRCGKVISVNHKHKLRNIIFFVITLMTKVFKLFLNKTQHF